MSLWNTVGPKTFQTIVRPYTVEKLTAEEYCEYQKVPGGQVALAVGEFPVGINPSPVSEWKPHECGSWGNIFIKKWQLTVY